MQMIQQISEGLLYSLAQHFIGGSAVATSAVVAAAAVASGPPAGVGCCLCLPTSTGGGGRVVGRIALGHVAHAPVKKTEILC